MTRLQNLEIINVHSSFVDKALLGSEAPSGQFYQSDEATYHFKTNSNTYKARFENHFQWGCVSGMSRCNELDWLPSFGPECGHFLLCVWILDEAPVCSVSSAQARAA